MTTLKGPADADHYRVKVGQSRWYCDPLPSDERWEATDAQWPSVSATKPPFANRYVTIKSLAEMDPAEITWLAGIDTDRRYDAYKAHERATSLINMNRGTIVHAWAEDLLADRPMVDPTGLYDRAAVEAAAAFRPGLEQFFEDYNPSPIAVEVPCIHRSLNGFGYGGTADVFADLGEHGRWVIDWKSRKSDHGAYVEEAAQGGAYLGAEYMVVVGVDGQPVRIPIPQMDGILIVSITDTGYRCFPVDAASAVDAYRAMHTWWVSQRVTKFGRAWAPRPVPSMTPADSALGVTPADVDPAGDLLARLGL